MLVGAVKSGDYGIKARKSGFATNDTQSVVKSWAKWCERYGEANKTEECGWFLFALGKKLIQSVLEILWRPLSDFAKLFDALAQQRDNFVFGKLFESLVVVSMSMSTVGETKK